MYNIDKFLRCVDFATEINPNRTYVKVEGDMYVVFATKHHNDKVTLTLQHLTKPISMPLIEITHNENDLVTTYIYDPEK